MTFSYQWPTPVDQSPLKVRAGDRFLRDAQGRAWLLRGVNLSGASKMPKYPLSVGSHVGGQAFLNQEGDMLDQEISFVGRPFELDDADEHLSRLRHWGFRMLRWVVTWEAIEHKGPGQYDEEFMSYTVKALSKAGEYGFKVMIDFHQDVWSRFTGGSGAPLWTLYAAGLDPAHFETTGAALVHNLAPDKPFPRMGWLTNYYKLACATMFTLFYAGSTLAPRCTFEGGTNIQEYLQRHLVQAMTVLAQRILAFEGGRLVLPQNNNQAVVVLGWDSWNEPSAGWIGLDRLDRLPDEHDARQADMPTPFQTMLLGQGLAVDRCQTYEMSSLGPAATGVRAIDPRGVRAWLTPEKREAMDRRYGIRRDPSFPRAHECLWAQHGVWSIPDQKVLQQDYFAVGPLDPVFGLDESQASQPPRSRRPLNWVEDHWTVFALRVTAAIRAVLPDTILFLEPPVYTPPPNLLHAKTTTTTPPVDLLLDNMVYTPHHYDDLALVVRRYLDWVNIDLLGLSRKRCSSLPGAIVIGRQSSRQLFGQQIGSMVEECDTRLGIRPVLIGETGIPMDLALESPKAAKPLWQRLLHLFTSGGPNTSGDHAANKPFIQQGTSAGFQQCFDNILQGLDRNLVHYTLWNYTPENTAEHGEHWNGENLSLYSQEQQRIEEREEKGDEGEPDLVDPSRCHPLDRGARALDVFCRPYPVITVGTPLHLTFDRHQKVFQVWISTGLGADTTIDGGVPLTRSATTFANVRLLEEGHENSGPSQEISSEEHQARRAAQRELATELYIPNYHFGRHAVVSVSEGEWFWDREQQILYWYHDQHARRVASLRVASH